MDPPKTYAKSSTNITGWIVTSVSISGWRLMCERLRAHERADLPSDACTAFAGVRGA